MITFCEKCRKLVMFKEESVRIRVRVKGKVYEYDGKRGVCLICGSEVYVPEVEDNNLK